MQLEQESRHIPDRRVPTFFHRLQERSEGILVLGLILLLCVRISGWWDWAPALMTWLHLTR